jgi:hypothetical protein
MPNWWPFQIHFCKTGHPAAVCSKRLRHSRVTFAAQATTRLMRRHFLCRGGLRRPNLSRASPSAQADFHAD